MRRRRPSGRRVPSIPSLSEPVARTGAVAPIAPTFRRAPPTTAGEVPQVHPWRSDCAMMERHPAGHRKGLVQDDRRQTLRTIGAATARSVAEEDLPPLPARPTLADLFTLRFHKPRFGLPVAAAPHGLQCASLAMRAGADEETVLACLLHDVGMVVMRSDHGWWGAQLVEPYVSERVSWAIRHHQALRFFPDPEVGYEYPELYVQMFGPDYQPPDYVVAGYQHARGHRWYMTARTITLFDDYSFDPKGDVSLDPFHDLIGRHFRQPAEGLGNDSSPTAHMWRTLIDPNKPL
jgi:hypothetical protein